MKVINLSFRDSDINLLLQMSFPLPVNFYNELKKDRQAVFYEMQEEIASRVHMLLSAIEGAEEIKE